MWIEVKGTAVEMYKHNFNLTEHNQRYIEIPLRTYLDDLDDWKKVKEICLVFRPSEKPINGIIIIEDIKLTK